MVRLGISGLLERLNALLRLLGSSPIARALAPSDLTLELRSLRSTIITRFITIADLSATRRGPAWSSRIAGWELTPRRVGLPMLMRSSFARMSTSLPRRPDPVLVLLTSSVSGGLRPSLAGSTLALTVSRPARRSLMFQPACSLTPFRGLLHQRLRPGPLPARAAPVASGWSNSCRVGYPPPTGVTHPSHGALRIRVYVGSDIMQSIFSVAARRERLCQASGGGSPRRCVKNGLD